MKKILIVLLAIAFSGCVTATVHKLPPQEIVVKVENGTDAKVEAKKDEPDKIRKVMNVPYKEPEFSGDAIQIGDMVFYSIWGHISSIEPLNFKKTLEVMRHKGIKKMKLFINSGGGNAFDGMAVADMMEKSIKEGVEINTEASGLIASAAVPIFAVGQYRISTHGTMFMVHQGKLFKLFSQEDKADLKAQHMMMSLEEDRYNTILEKHTNLSKKEWADRCEKTTWFTAREAKEWGLLDEIR